MTSQQSTFKNRSPEERQHRTVLARLSPDLSPIKAISCSITVLEVIASNPFQCLGAPAVKVLEADVANVLRQIGELLIAAGRNMPKTVARGAK